MLEFGLKCPFVHLGAERTKNLVLRQNFYSKCISQDSKRTVLEPNDYYDSDGVNSPESLGK